MQDPHIHVGRNLMPTAADMRQAITTVPGLAVDAFGGAGPAGATLEAG